MKSYITSSKKIKTSNKNLTIRKDSFIKSDTSNTFKWRKITSGVLHVCRIQYYTGTNVSLDPYATYGPNWEQNFGQTIDFGYFRFLRSRNSSSNSSITVLEEQTGIIPSFDINWICNFECQIGNRPNDVADGLFEFLDKDDNPIFYLKCTKRSSYTVDFEYGTDLNDLGIAPQRGTYALVNGNLEFFNNKITYTTNSASANYVGDWEFYTDVFPRVKSIRVTSTCIHSNNDTNGASTLLLSVESNKG